MIFLLDRMEETLLLTHDRILCLNAEGEEKREQPKVDEPHKDTPAGGAVPAKELPRADDADGKPFGMSKHLFPKARRFGHTAHAVGSAALGFCLE
jgi:hypothetical protein